MNYEQKYKEALAWVESIYPELNHEHQMEAEAFFPELAESEDERVREDILAFVKREGQHIDKYKWHKWIAWLEKLKVFAEHGDGLYYFGNNGFTYVCNPIWDNSSWLEKQGEQKSATIDIDKMVNYYANNKERGNEEFGKPVNCMIRAYRQGLNDAIGKVVFKSWSEEDEERFQSCLNILQVQAKGFMGITETINTKWLKSLKQRIGG